MKNALLKLDAYAIAIGIVLTGKVYHEAYRFSRFCFMVCVCTEEPVRAVLNRYF